MAKGKKAVKKAIKKITKPKAVKKPSLVSKAVTAVKKALPVVGAAAIGAGTAYAASKFKKTKLRLGRRPRTARQMLKKAYEMRAKRQVRQGMLGHARRTLRKKATVV